MSVAASRYAITVLRADKSLGQGARAVLLAAAAAADHRSHDTFTGEWLAEAAGMGAANMRRNVKRLAALGYFTVDHRRGKASAIRFPLGAVLAEAAPGDGRRDENGAFHPTFCGCPDCLERTAEA